MYRGRSQGGKRGGGRGKGEDRAPARRGGASGGRGAGSEPHRAVAINLPFAKHSLRKGLTAQTGFYLQGAPDEKSFLKLAEIAKTRTTENCELVNDLGKGMSMGAADAQYGMEAFSKLFSSASTGESFVASGVVDLIDYMKSANGKAFLKASAFLNVKHDVARGPGEVEQRVIDYLKFFLHESSEPRLVALKKIAVHTSKVYTMAMSMLEQAALFTSPETFVEKVASSSKAPAGIRAWRRSPDDERHMLETMAAAWTIRAQEEGGASAAGVQNDEEGWDDGDAGGPEDNPFSEDELAEARVGARASRSRGLFGAQPGGSHKARRGLFSEAPEKRLSPLFGPGAGGAKRPRGGGAAGQKQTEILLVAEDEGDSDEDPFEEVDPPAAYTEWPQGEAQRIGALMAISKTNLHDKKNRLTLETWRETLASIPASVLQAHGLGSLLKDLQGFSRMPKQASLVPLLDQIQKMANAVEAFYASQSGRSEGSGPGAAPAIKKEEIEEAGDKDQKADDDGVAVSVEQKKKTTVDAGSKGQKADATAPKATAEKK
jgi:hypothetical protein